MQVQIKSFCVEKRVKRTQEERYLVGWQTKLFQNGGDATHISLIKIRQKVCAYFKDHVRCGWVFLSL